ncbi:hypothetical protein HK101_006053 [Irineochytrium annulatum]|nr:hypothetical protein HK101_006053 [Irineochytrium annulatum]
MVEAHQFDGTSGTWVKVGEVVDAVGQKRKQIYNGKEYDYVFDVDIGDGVNLKLPYNASENPYAAAQDFIHRNELSQDFLDQIANFITQNAGNVTLEPQSTANADPYTGGNRYVPGSSKVYSSFKALNYEAVHSKILSLNGALAFGNLTEEELKALKAGVSSLEKGFSLSDQSLRVILKIAFEWPIQSRFPGLDLLRVTVLNMPPLLQTEFTSFFEGLAACASAPNDTNVTLFFKLPNIDPEAGYRALIAFGTLLCIGGSVKEAAGLMNASQAVKELKLPADSKTVAVTSELRERKKAATEPPVNGRDGKREKASDGGCLSTLLLIVGLIITTLAVSFVTTESLTFGYKVPNLNKLLPVRSAPETDGMKKEETPKAEGPAPSSKKRKELVLTTEELAQYDGSDPDKPIYLAIKYLGSTGKVYDVSAGPKYYGKGGGYSFFSGKDAARAYITGCFQTHLVPDLRGLTPEEIASLSQWSDFYEKHDKYFYVGKVVHKELTDDDPIPEPCNLASYGSGLSGGLGRTTSTLSVRVMESFGTIAESRLEALTELSSFLHLNNSSTGSHKAAVANASLEHDRAQSELQRYRRMLTVVKKKRRWVSSELERTNRILADAETSDVNAIEQLHRNVAILQEKGAEYAERCSELENLRGEQDFGGLLKLKETVRVLAEEVAAKDLTLSAYEGVPSDITLARLKIKERKAELAALIQKRQDLLETML